VEEATPDQSADGKRERQERSWARSHPPRPEPGTPVHGSYGAPAQRLGVGPKVSTNPRFSQSSLQCPVLPVRPWAGSLLKVPLDPVRGSRTEAIRRVHLLKSRLVRCS